MEHGADVEMEDSGDESVGDHDDGATGRGNGREVGIYTTLIPILLDVEKSLVRMTTILLIFFKVYIPGISRALKRNEELEFDPDAYKLFHSFETSKSLSCCCSRICSNQ